MRDSQPAPNAPWLGESWRVAVVPGCSSGCQGTQCQACSDSEKNAYSTRCGIIADKSGPFKECHAYVVHCVFDVCAMDRDRGTLCKSIQAYAIACQLAGAQIQAWRSSSFCPVSCPANSHYELCSDTCGTSCASLVDSFTCSASCFEGCPCDVGFASDGDKCVSMDTCGCVYEGQYLRVGQVVVTKGCDSKCVCQASGLVRYEKRICASGEVCGVKNEVRGCQLKHGHCMVHPGAHFTTFDCMRGVMGLGAFEVASLCDQTSAQWFRVVVDVRVCSNGAYPNVATVYVFFKDVTVTVNSQHNTWVSKAEGRVMREWMRHTPQSTFTVAAVNGKNVSLTSTPANQLFVSIADRTVVIKRVSGYKGIVKDDMTTADRQSSTDVTVIVSSWRLGTSLA
ncbi:unnamed protein product, partial [Coregonus sp. 'balchen']